MRTWGTEVRRRGGGRGGGREGEWRKGGGRGGVGKGGERDERDVAAERGDDRKPLQGEIEGREGSG